jgi:hypothetical protein
MKNPLKELEIRRKFSGTGIKLLGGGRTYSDVVLNLNLLSLCKIDAASSYSWARDTAFCDKPWPIIVLLLKSALMLKLAVVHEEVKKYEPRAD